MGGYDDYRKDEERFLTELDELAEAGAAAEWERRLAERSSKTGKSKRIILSARRRAIKNAMSLRPDFTEVQATAWVDRTLGLKDSD